jgi:hypothetical protein
MSSLFGSSKMPEIKTVTPPAVSVPVPTSVSDIAKVTEEEKKKLTKGREKRSTLLTGPLGLLAPADVTRKTLLGE